MAQLLLFTRPKKPRRYVVVILIVNCRRQQREVRDGSRPDCHGTRVVQMNPFGPENDQLTVAAGVVACSDQLMTNVARIVCFPFSIVGSIVEHSFVVETS